MIPQLQWGLASAVPPEAIGAWGARVIVNQEGLVDIVPDRVDQVGSEAIFDILTAEFSMAKLRQTLGDMLRSGQVSTGRRGCFELYQSPRLVVRGDCNGSGGYAYLVAYAVKEEQS